MTANIEIDESNGSPETITHEITNCNMGSADVANMPAGVYLITPGNKSYEKYQRFHVLTMGGSSKINNLKVWRTGALGGLTDHRTNARQIGYIQASYNTPVNSLSVVATENMPTAMPATANLGIDGALDGEITSDDYYSDYLVHQIQTNSADTSTGSTSKKMHYQYDETV
jgi:hypothetical protein